MAGFSEWLIKTQARTAGLLAARCGSHGGWPRLIGDPRGAPLALVDPLDDDVGLRGWAGQIVPSRPDHEKDPATCVQCQLGERCACTFEITEALQHVYEDATAFGQLDQDGIVRPTSRRCASPAVRMCVAFWSSTPS